MFLWERSSRGPRVWVHAPDLHARIRGEAQPWRKQEPSKGFMYGRDVMKGAFERVLRFLRKENKHFQETGSTLKM